MVSYIFDMGNVEYRNIYIYISLDIDIIGWLSVQNFFVSSTIINMFQHMSTINNYNLHTTIIALLDPKFENLRVILMIESILVRSSVLRVSKFECLQRTNNSDHSGACRSAIPSQKLWAKYGWPAIGQWNIEGQTLPDGLPIIFCIYISTGYSVNVYMYIFVRTRDRYASDTQQHIT